MINIVEFFRIFNLIEIQDGIGNPPYDYYFLKNLDEREYPLYLAKLFYLNTGEKLPLKYDFKNKSWIIDKKKCKTFNQKIQWLKLYDTTYLKKKCTDKVLVRDYVAEKIGSEYLKPVLQVIPSLNCDCNVIARNNSTLGDEAIRRKRSQLTMNKNTEDKQLKSGPDCHVAIAPRNDRQLNDVSTYFDQINFDKLPNAFVIKCNHGCKWHYIIKDKEEFLKNKRLFDIVRRKMTGWLEQDYSFWNGFEMQYRGIEPKIFLEQLLRNEINKKSETINVYCFKGKPAVIVKFHNENKMSIWDENFISIGNIFCFAEENIKMPIDKFIKQSVELSVELSKSFNFVRVDWMIYQNKLYFEELTFTPYSGMIKYTDKDCGLILGSYIKLS